VDRPQPVWVTPSPAARLSAWLASSVRLEGCLEALYSEAWAPTPLTIGPTTLPGASTVAGITSLNAQSNFVGVLSPGLTGRRDGAIGTLTVTSTGTGTGPFSVNSANDVNVFAGGQAVATNPFGSAGGLGSGAATAASTATGASVDDLLAAISCTGTATGNFNNAGAAAFAVPPNVFGATGNSFVGE
jgi:hypothetical protein